MQPPNWLDTHGKEYWLRLANEFGVTSKTDKLFELAAANYSIARQAQHEIKVHGVIVESKSGDYKANPAMAVLTQANAKLAQLLRTLFSIVPDTINHDDALDKFLAE